VLTAALPYAHFSSTVGGAWPEIASRIVTVIQFLKICDELFKVHLYPFGILLNILPPRTRISSALTIHNYF
jgi:hypothetical protein